MLLTEGGMKIGGVPRMTSMERPSQSSSAHNHPSTTISSLSSSQYVGFFSSTHVFLCYNFHLLPKHDSKHITHGFERKFLISLNIPKHVAYERQSLDLFSASMLPLLQKSFLNSLVLIFQSTISPEEPKFC